MKRQITKFFLASTLILLSAEITNADSVPTPVTIDFTTGYVTPDKDHPLRPKDEMQPFACMYTGTGLDFTFTDSMGTVRIAVTNLNDGSESTYSIWTPAIHYTIPVQPGIPYQITVTFHSGDTYIGLIQ